MTVTVLFILYSLTVFLDHHCTIHATIVNDYYHALSPSEVGFEIVVKLNENVKESDQKHVIAQISKDIGVLSVSKIGSLPGYFMLESGNINLNDDVDLKKALKNLRGHSLVEWCKPQRLKKRVKRDYIPLPNWSDPYLKDQWYLYGRNTQHMRVAEAWALGYTGRNISVTILDDGIQPDHPDLIDNYDDRLSSDINGLDDDPTPRDNGRNRHGTRCAGEVAAAKDNAWCGVGIAYNSRIGGIRMLDGRINDRVEAAALSHNPEHIAIYSASWGPDDNGMTVDGPGILAKKAMLQGVQRGREGRGNIYVWASGNGGAAGDSCSCDGYTTSIYTLSISSATSNHKKPWYSEECPATLACTYSSGNSSDPAVVTTDMPNSCTRYHTGTSASAPIAAAIVALALEANPNLSWRDMQHLVIMSSNPKPLAENDGWLTNGEGRNVSSQFGYGLMDAEALIKHAKTWKSVGKHIKCSFDYVPENKRNPRLQGHFKQVYSLDVMGCHGSSKGQIRHLEHVQPVISIRSLRKRGDLKMTLISPAGTRSVILPPRKYDRKGGAGFYRWPFLSVQQWGEDPRGRWMLVLENVGKPDNTASLWLWSLVLYGTEEAPQMVNSTVRAVHKCDACRSSHDCNECMGNTSFLKKIAPWTPLILLIFLAAIVVFMIFSAFKNRWWIFPKRTEPRVIFDGQTVSTIVPPPQVINNGAISPNY